LSQALGLYYIYNYVIVYYNRQHDQNRGKISLDNYLLYNHRKF